MLVVLVLVWSAQAGISAPLIIQIAPTASIASIVTQLGGSLVDSIPGSGIYLVNVPVVPASTVASLLGIQWMELNTNINLPNFALPGLIRVPGSVAADWYKNQPSYMKMRAGDALSYSRGRGVVVADLNSSVDYSHPALVGHLTSGYDFVSSKPGGYGVLEQSENAVLEQSENAVLEQSENAVLEESGAILEPLGVESLSPASSHGTLCSGVIAVIAPDSMIMPLRVFDDNGGTDLFMVAKAVRWAVTHGAQVINMSFGTSTNSQAIKNAVNFAQNSNVVVVASAGNSNTSAPHYPSAFAGVLSTAAVDLFDTKASFSNFGSSIVVDAPGSNIIGPYPGGYYTIASGTSFAAPAVAGTAALVRSLQTSGVANAITGGAVDIDSQNPNYARQLGYGRIDVLRAVRPN